MTIQAAVVYDSYFGNNMRLAKALTTGLEEGGATVECMKIGSFDIQKLSSFDFIAVGGPTHIARMSKPMKEFFDELRTVNLRGKRGFCFGTRMESKMNRFDINGSAKRIEGRLKKNKVKLIKPRINIIVEGREGPLTEGSETQFNEIGHEIAKLMEAV